MLLEVAALPLLHQEVQREAQREVQQEVQQEAHQALGPDLALVRALAKALAKAPVKALALAPELVLVLPPVLAPELALARPALVTTLPALATTPPAVASPGQAAATQHRPVTRLPLELATLVLARRRPQLPSPQLREEPLMPPETRRRLRVTLSLRHPPQTFPALALAILPLLRPAQTHQALLLVPQDPALAPVLQDPALVLVLQDPELVALERVPVPEAVEPELVALEQAILDLDLGPGLALQVLVRRGKADCAVRVSAASSDLGY